MKNGITIAGNIIVDSIMHIGKYPRPGMLANIISIEQATGGCLANTIVDVARIDPSLRLVGLGCVGDDDNGRFALKYLHESGIDVSNIIISKTARTSFTDAMQDRTTGERTFFTFGGASDEFNYDSIDYDAIDTDIFHLGYALLLAGMDAPNPEFGTVMAKTLAKVHSMGVKTSMDIVSEDSPRAGGIIRCSLKYCDYLIVNEQESSVAAEIPIRDGRGKLIAKNMRPLCEKMFELGVKDIVTIHCPEGSFSMEASGAYHEQPSFNLPQGFIVGTTGAGDAFCAGMLFGIYNGWELTKSMRFGNGVAASSLRGSGGTTTVCDRHSIERLMDKLEENRNL